MILKESSPLPKLMCFNLWDALSLRSLPATVDENELSGTQSIVLAGKGGDDSP